MDRSGGNMQNVPEKREEMTWSIAPMNLNKSPNIKGYLPPLVPFSRRLPPPPPRPLPPSPSGQKPILVCPCPCRFCYQHSRDLLKSFSSTRRMFEEALDYITASMDSVLSTLGLETLGDEFFF